MKTTVTVSTATTTRKPEPHPVCRRSLDSCFNTHHVDRNTNVHTKSQAWCAHLTVMLSLKISFVFLVFVQLSSITVTGISSCRMVFLLVFRVRREHGLMFSETTARRTSLNEDRNLSTDQFLASLHFPSSSVSLFDFVCMYFHVSFFIYIYIKSLFSLTIKK